MEEVDNIILQTLHQVGVKVSEDLISLSELPENFVLFSAKRCLDIIMGVEEEFELPEETSQKIILSNDIMSLCKKLGYREKLGYELFLYPNETDTRKILTFLINKLPKEAEKTYMYLMGDEFSLLMQRISQQISEDLSTPWAPAYCKGRTFKVSPNGEWTKSGCRHIYPFDKIHFNLSKDNVNKVEAFQDYWNNCFPNGGNDLIETFDSESQADIIVEKLKLSKSHNLTNLLLKESKSFTSKLSLDAHSSPGSLLDNKFLSLDKLEEENKKLIEKIDISRNTHDMVSKELTDEKVKEISMKGEIETLSLVTSLLPEAETNMEKLKLIHEKESNKLLALTNEMNALEIRCQKESEEMAKRKVKHSKHYDTIKSLQNRVKRLSDEHNKQINLKLQLRKDCDKRNLRKKYTKKRSAYTKRIMEIIGNISKQKIEINKILSDTRILQKEMNNLNGRLDRSFTVVDELVFKDAKKDEHARKAYKLIAYIHTGCSEIVNKVNEIGSNLREIRDLEKHVETENKKNIKENLQRVCLDLKYVQSKKQ